MNKGKTIFAQLKLDHSIYTLLQIFSLSLFEKVPVNELLTIDNCKTNFQIDDKQMRLFDL